MTAGQLTLEGRPDRPPREVEVFVPGIPPTPNDRLHWRETAKVRAAWKALTMYHAGRPTEDHPPLAPVGTLVDVELVFVYAADRRRDPDNQIASAKPILDGLVAAGLLPDDSNRVIRRLSAATEIRRSSIEGIRITLREVLDS